MSQWVIKGIRTGIKTTAYPARGNAPPASPRDCPSAASSSAPKPRRWLSAVRRRCSSEHGRSIVVGSSPLHALLPLRPRRRTPVDWQQTYEWATVRNGQTRIGPAVPPLHSHHRRGCGRLRRVPQRGQATQQSLLQHAPAGVFHHAHAAPRGRAVGSRAGDRPHALRAAKNLRRHADAQSAWSPSARARLSGGVFADSFVCSKGVAEVLPVDVEVPGNPPPPLAILHGLLVAVGRKPPRVAVAHRT